MEQDFSNFFTSYRVDTICRLIQNDKLGIVYECLGEPEALHHTLRVFADLRLSPLGHSDNFQCLIDTLAKFRLRNSRELTKICEYLLAGQIEWVSVILRQISQPFLRMDRSKGIPQNASLAGLGKNNTKNALDKCRLASPILTEQSEYFTG